MSGLFLVLLSYRAGYQREYIYKCIKIAYLFKGETKLKYKSYGEAESFLCAHTCVWFRRHETILYSRTKETRGNQLFLAFDKWFAVLKIHFSCFVTANSKHHVLNRIRCVICSFNGHISIRTQNKLLNLESACLSLPLFFEEYLRKLWDNEQQRRTGKWIKNKGNGSCAGW